MKKQLEAVRAKCEAMRIKAEETADDSERDTTQDRYTAIAEHLDEAIMAIESAIAEFDS